MDEKESYTDNWLSCNSETIQQHSTLGEKVNTKFITD